ncbi:MAG TPA: YkgJ family cysteine cluster protein [Thermodesulfobacteriaceae bacterium]|nr:YkgJ family cysteine cluster protein [Thermodesulfobacteriaceae bacterium]
MKKIFECKRCGFCCQGESTVSLSPEEIERIAAYLGLSKDDFLKRYAVRKDKRIEMKTINGHCIFYDEKEGLCRVHPVKPDRCREWPLHPSILKDVENFEIIKNTCPGFEEGISWEEVKEYLK